MSAFSNRKIAVMNVKPQSLQLRYRPQILKLKQALARSSASPWDLVAQLFNPSAYSATSYAEMLRAFVEAGLMHSAQRREIPVECSVAQNDYDEEIERRLIEMLERVESERLPPVRELAKAFHIATARLSRILARMSKVGLITIHKNHGIFKAGYGPHPKPSIRGKQPLSHQRIAKILHTEILAGRYRPGQLLPKQEYLAKVHAVSNKTISRAYHALAQQRLVIHKGKSFRVAARTEVVANGDSPESTILIVQYGESNWRRVALSEWAGGFARSFMREAAAARFQLAPVIADESGGERAHAHGRDQIRALIRDLNERYAGALVISRTDELFRQGESLATWLEWLLQFRRPVVWLDDLNQVGAGPSHWEQKSAYLRIASTLRGRSLLSRCYTDETAAVRCALEPLVRAGHRHIGFPWFRNRDMRWAQTRSAIAANVLAELSPAARLAKIDSALFDAFADERAMQTLLEAFAANTAHAGFRSVLMQAVAHLKKNNDHTRSQNHCNCRACLALASMLVDNGVTALVAPNDWYGREYRALLQMANLSVPRDLSLVSFDNNFIQMYPFTFSSVDFGFEHLGFMAFHLIVRDLPLTGASIRHVAAECTINHLGSIAAKRRSLRLAL